MVRVYRSQYSFKASHTSALSFSEGDLFLELAVEGKQDRNWYYVSSVRGDQGYVPRNYVSHTELGRADTLALVNETLSNLNTNPGLSTADKDEVGLQLQSLRERLAGLGLSSHSRSQDSVSSIKSCKKRAAPAPPQTGNSPQLPAADSADVMTEDHSQALQLVEQVRTETNLSHEASRSIVESILSTLASSSQDLNLLVPSLRTEIQSQLFQSEKEIQSSHDYTNLVRLLDLLTKMKEDDQQRNWMLYEDEAIITQQLSSVCSTLQEASKEISVSVLARYKYFYVQSLVEYFQMETRWIIRRLLIETFTVMCSLDPTNIIPLMLVSVLPLELVQNMFDTSLQADRLKHCSVLLTVLFSRGEDLPVQYKEQQLGAPFVTFLLDKVENSQQLDTEEDMADVFMGLLASYNLQFEQTEENIVLRCLASTTTAKIFTEKLLLLLNREDDPAEIIGSRAGVNSVHKLVLDVFSSPDCSAHFYTNDLMVLIDIIARQLADLGPGIER